MKWGKVPCTDGMVSCWASPVAPANKHLSYFIIPNVQQHRLTKINASRILFSWKFINKKTLYYHYSKYSSNRKAKHTQYYLSSILTKLFSTEQFADEWNQSRPTGEELGEDWLPKVWLCEYILSQQQGLDFGPCTSTLCLMTIHSRLPPLLSVCRAPGPVHKYCSSWQLIDLSVVLETPIREIVRAWLFIQDIIFSLMAGLGLTWHPVLASSA